MLVIFSEENLPSVIELTESVWSFKVKKLSQFDPGDNVVSTTNPFNKSNPKTIAKS